MKKLLCLVLSLQVLATIAGPLFDDYRLRKSPHRSIMVSGYYPSEFQPRSGTSAFISGETVATNSYLGGRYRPDQEAEELDAPADNHQNKGVQQVPEQVPPKPKQKPSKPREDDDDEETLLERRPSFNTFFPIIFGGYGGKERSDDGGLVPGSATAIANSYSTGRGGIATSRATAYGDPYASTLFRNGINFKRKPTGQEAY